MDEKVKFFFSEFCGILTTLSENYGTICSICCALILLDLLTGLAKGKNPGQAEQRHRLQGFLAQGCPARCPGLRYLPGSAGGVRRCRRPGGRVPHPDRAAARLLHRRQRVHLHHRKPLGLRRPAARFSRRSPREHQGQARPALIPALIMPVPESAVNPAPVGSRSLAALEVCHKILRF